MTPLSIIIVNWNCIDYTHRCLESIRDTAGDLAYEVIVVDNASNDAPCQSIVERFPWVKLILSSQNIGFGRANNLGVQHATGQFLFFLNPDTIVLGNALSQMLAEIQLHRDAGALACKLLNPDGTLQNCVLGFPTIANQILSLEWLQKRLPNLRLWGRHARSAKHLDRVREIEVAPGAAMLIPRPVFEQVRGFNPEYFMYAEEVDLCFAINRAGYRILHLNDAEIIHFGGQSTKQCEDGFAAVTMRDSVYLFFRRNHGNAYAMVYRLCLFLSALSRLALLACLAPFTAILAAPLKRRYVTVAFRKWLRIVKWSMGMANAGRPAYVNAIAPRETASRPNATLYDHASTDVIDVSTSN